MVKVLVDFDVISYRKHLIELKNKANQEFLKHKGTIEGMSWESMRNGFDIALQRMEEFATFENVNDR